jgi:uncharacterized protein with GYD domain
MVLSGTAAPGQRDEVGLGFVRRAFILQGGKGEMPLYMTQFAYTPEAWKALVKKPEDRGKVFGELVEKMGGRLVSMYYCMGEYDGLVIYEAPDESTAMATVLSAISPGHLRATKTTVLLSVDDTMVAMNNAKAEAYPGPKLWSPAPS